jgi:hypothetical protein
MPAYQEWLDSLANHKYPDNIYYSFLVYFKDDIMLAVGKANQGIVARSLHMHQTRFNPITFILKQDIHLDPSALRDIEDYLAICVEGQVDDDYTA